MTPTPEPGGRRVVTLDEAWAECMAVLPKGWGIGIEPIWDADTSRYEAGAGRNQWAVFDGKAHESPAAALRALAVALQSQEAGE
jgi:hypothetical protein